MKKFLFPLLAAFALTVGTAAAQTTPSTDAGPMRDRGRMQGNPDEMAKRQADRMTQELGLHADQTAKVQQILLARGQEMQAMRGQARDAGNRDQMREQMQANRAKYDAQFKEVLTADQYTKYTTMQADRMNRGGGPGMGGADVKKMKAKSTDGDKIKVKADK
jgi:periplasmic protein CpxP/Spy